MPGPSRWSMEGRLSGTGRKVGVQSINRSLSPVPDIQWGLHPYCWWMREAQLIASSSSSNDFWLCSHYPSDYHSFWAFETLFSCPHSSDPFSSQQPVWSFRHKKSDCVFSPVLNSAVARDLRIKSRSWQETQPPYQLTPAHSMYNNWS